MSPLAWFTFLCHPQFLSSAGEAEGGQPWPFGLSWKSTRQPSTGLECCWHCPGHMSMLTVPEDWLHCVQVPPLVQHPSKG